MLGLAKKNVSFGPHRMLFDLNPLAQVNGMVKKYGTIF